MKYMLLDDGTPVQQDDEYYEYREQTWKTCGAMLAGCRAVHDRPVRRASDSGSVANSAALDIDDAWRAFRKANTGSSTFEAFVAGAKWANALPSGADNNASTKLVDDIECARDWLLSGNRPVKQIEIDNCVRELNDIIDQLRT